MEAIYYAAAGAAALVSWWFLRKYRVLRARRQAFYKEYFEILTLPQYKVKGQSEE